MAAQVYGPAEGIEEDLTIRTRAEVLLYLLTQVRRRLPVEIARQFAEDLQALRPRMAVMSMNHAG